MSIKNRLVKLEAAQGVNKVDKYICVFPTPWTSGWDTPEEKAGFKIQPCVKEFGGTGGASFYLATQKELDAFGARPDVDLTIINIEFTDTPITQKEE